MGKQSSPLKKWVHALPHSRMIYPSGFVDRAKYWFWHLLTPYHHLIRDAVVALHIYKYDGRQDFLIGKVAPGLSVEDVILYLISKGYGNHFVAWDDDGQVVSLRHTPTFTHQYHVRIFHDGEVRAHYELTPESYPFKHLKEVGMEARRDEFLSLLGDKIVPLETTEE